MKKKRGSSLAYVLLITAGVMVVGTTCLSTLSMGLKTTIQENKRVQSLYGADAGIEWAKSLLIGTFQTATEYAEQQVKEEYKYNFDSSKLEDLNLLFKQKFREFVSPNESNKDNVNNEFVQALVDKKYYDSTDKSSAIEIGFSDDETVIEPKLEVISSNYENDTYRIELKSMFESVDSGIKNEREISVVFEIKVPDFQGQYLDESVDVYPVFNDKVMAIDGDLNISDSNVNVSGDIFVVGNEVNKFEIPQYDKYKGGITLKNADLTSTNNIVTANTVNLVSNSTLDGESLYARNLYLGSTEAKDYPIDSWTVKDNIVNLGEVVLDNDLTIKAKNSSVVIDNFYGINDKTYEKLEVTAQTADIKTTSKTSSSIIVNQTEGSSLTINGEAYIMGVAYIDTQGGKYETGESIAVKGNYVAYTQPLIGTDFESAQFNYYEPLYLVDEINGKNLSVLQKNDYFYEFAKKQAMSIGSNQVNNNDQVILNEENSILKSGGIQLPNSDKVYTVGAIVYIKDNNLVIERANIPTGDKITKQQVIYADKVYNMGDLYNKDDDKDTSLYNSAEQLTVQKSINFTKLEDNCQLDHLDCDNLDNILLETSTEKTLNLGSNNGKGQFTGVILSNSDIVIDGDFELTGIIMTTGTVTIKNSKLQNSQKPVEPTVTLEYDENVIQTIISKNYELFDGVFQGNAKDNDVNGFLEYDSKNYNLKDFIKTSNWKLER